MFENGVLSYTKGVAKVVLFFPKGFELCQYCRFIRCDKELKRFRCALSDEWILDPFVGRGRECPVALEGGESCVSDV